VCTGGRTRTLNNNTSCPNKRPAMKATLGKKPLPPTLWTRARSRLARLLGKLSTSIRRESELPINAASPRYSNCWAGTACPKTGRAKGGGRKREKRCCDPRKIKTGSLRQTIAPELSDRLKGLRQLGSSACTHMGQCPLLGVKRTLPKRPLMSAFDP